MVLLPTHTPVHAPSIIKGTLFGARGDSCSCNPCDCNPCRCGNSLVPQLPFWRASGCLIEEGHLGEATLSHLVILSLAQPDEAGIWNETLLVEYSATPDQIAGLLALFEDELESLPAELGPQPRGLRAVYRVPLTYVPDASRPFLQVTFTREHATLVRNSEKQGHFSPREWVYDGPMAVRGTMERS